MEFCIVFCEVQTRKFRSWNAPHSHTLCKRVGYPKASFSNHSWCVSCTKVPTTIRDTVGQIHPWQCTTATRTGSSTSIKPAPFSAHTRRQVCRGVHGKEAFQDQSFRFWSIQTITLSDYEATLLYVPGQSKIRPCNVSNRIQHREEIDFRFADWHIIVRCCGISLPHNHSWLRWPRNFVQLVMTLTSAIFIIGWRNCAYFTDLDLVWVARLKCSIFGGFVALIFSTAQGKRGTFQFFARSWQVHCRKQNGRVSRLPSPVFIPETKYMCMVHNCTSLLFVRHTSDYNFRKEWRKVFKNQFVWKNHAHWRY